MLNSPLRSALLLFSILSLHLHLASAQFNFFEQMFGGGGHPGHQHHQQQQHHTPGNSQWTAHSEHVSCSQYLCPATLDCVPKPVDCPCPAVEDIKCIIPDSQDKDAGTVLCVRGKEECAGVERITQQK